MLRKAKRGGVIFILSLLALVGCQSEKLVDDGGSQGGQQFSLTASRGVQSRTHLGDPYEDENGKKILPMYWTEGDQIYVSSKDGRVTGTLTLTSEPGRPTGTFTGFVFGDPADLYYSIYPVPDGGKVDLSTLTGREIRTPMVGTISASKNVAFDNTCGMMVVENLDYEEGDKTTASFKLFAGTDTDNLIPLAATAEIEKDENGVVKVDAEGNVSLKYTSKNDAKYINLTDAEFIEGKLYIPYDLKSNATKENIHFYMKSDDSQNLESITNSPVSLKDATIGKPLYAGAKILVDDEGIAKKVPNKEITTENTSSNHATVEVAESENAVNIPSIPVGITNVTIEMPQTLENDKKTAIIAIEEIKSENATITITSASTNNSSPDDNTTTDTASQIEEMTVILPSGTTEEQAAKTVVIEMPNTTVTVKSDDGQILKIAKMEAATAEHTLVIGENVEVGELVVKEGNVRVHGKVSNVSRDPNGNNNDKKTVIELHGSGTASLAEGVDENDFQIIPAGKAVITNQPLAALLGKVYTEDVTIEDGNAVFDKDWAESLDALNLGTGWHKDIVVQNLKGIENFPNITYFCCAYQGVKECDFSTNMKLKEIYVHGNDLQSINVSKNEALETLAVFYNTELQDLDISNCTAIEDLDIRRTNLSELNLSNNTRLLYLNASDCSLLSNLNLEDCNNIVSVNVSNTKLTSLELEAPENITSLKISGVSALSDMSLAEFTSLKTLECANLGWTSIPLTAKQKSMIGNLNCSGNNITMLDLSEYPSLATLKCEGNKLTKMNLSVLKYLKTLLCGNQTTGILTLTLNDEQKELWNSSWKAKNPNVKVDGLVEEEVEEGTPVATLEQLTAALDDETVKNILLTKPIELTEVFTMDLGGRILFIDKDIFANHPDATAAIRSTANLTIQNGTIYGPELEKSVQKYIVEFENGSDKNDQLSLNEVTMESRGVENAIFVKNGYFNLQNSSIKASRALEFSSSSRCVLGQLIDGNIEGNVKFINNYQHTELSDLDMSGLKISGNTKIQGDLTKDGGVTMLFDIMKEEKTSYTYDDLNGNGWFEATVYYLQYLLNKYGIVNMSSWDLKEDVVFEVNRDEAQEKTIRFCVIEELGGNGKITFKNTGEVKLELMYTLPDDRFTCEGSFGEPTKVDW